MAYSSPANLTLRTSVLRDASDPNQDTFSDAMITDYINGGIAELNLVRPLEVRALVANVAGLSTAALSYIFRVEAIRLSDLAQVTIPHNTGESHWRNGWEFFAGVLTLDPAWYAKMDLAWENATHSLYVDGYRSRDPMVSTDDAQETEFSAIEEEIAVRRFAQLSAYRALQIDRALYEQWQTASNNSDVSPTQLTNMVAYTEADWERLKKRLYRPRRPIVQG